MCTSLLAKKKSRRVLIAISMMFSFWFFSGLGDSLFFFVHTPRGGEKQQHVFLDETLFFSNSFHVVAVELTDPEHGNFMQCSIHTCKYTSTCIYICMNASSVCVRVIRNRKKTHGCPHIRKRIITTEYSIHASKGKRNSNSNNK